MNVQVSIPNQGNIRVELFNQVLQFLLASQQHYSLSLFLNEARPTDLNMNRICQKAIERDQDWILTIDSDTIPLTNPIPLIALAKEDTGVIACPYPILQHQAPAGAPLQWSVFIKKGNKFAALPLSYKPSSPIESITHTGAGCLLINAKMLKTIEPPWFEYQWNKSTFEMNLGHDLYFCEKVLAAGFRILCAWQYPCDHIRVAKYSQITGPLCQVQ